MSSGSGLLEKIKEQFCNKCELSLHCMMGREVDRPMFCASCQGIVLDEGITVQCTCFTHLSMGLNQPLHALPLSGKGMQMVLQCPACKGEEGARLIQGFVEGRE